jgi:hypothetical protein
MDQKVQPETGFVKYKRSGINVLSAMAIIDASAPSTPYPAKPAHQK